MRRVKIRDMIAVSVALSDSDYQEFVQAVAWIRRHAGVDAPEYPGLDRLSEVVGVGGKLGLPSDEVADRRDDEAAVRDQVADDRDRSANRRDTRALLEGEPGDPRSTYRVRRKAAADRVESAHDRADAASDRDNARGNRAAAALDRQRAAPDDLDPDN